MRSISSFWPGFSGRLHLIPAVFVLVVGLMSGVQPVLAGLEADSTEVIEQVGKVVDVGTESLGKLYETQPKLFENLKDTVTALKVVDHLANARDSEALAELVAWQIGKQLDAVLEKLLPSPALSVLSWAKIYHGSLELIRDFMVIPAMDERLYQAYRRQRQGTGGASPEDAFSEVTVLPASGYYLVKSTMLDKYYKAKGYKKEQIGERMEAAAVKQIDNFWNARLETRYAKEQLHAQRETVVKQLWEAKSAQLAAIRQAVTQAGADGPFLTKADLASLPGWHFSQYTFWPPSAGQRFEPSAPGDQGIRTQSFFLQADGFSERKDSQGYPVEHDRAGQRMPSGTARVHVVLHTWPRVFTGTHQGTTYSLDVLETVKQLEEIVKSGGHAAMRFVSRVDIPGFAYGVLYERQTQDVEQVYFFDGVSQGNRIQVSTGYTIYQGKRLINFDPVLIDGILRIVSSKLPPIKE